MVKMMFISIFLKNLKNRFFKKSQKSIFWIPGGAWAPPINLGAHLGPPINLGAHLGPPNKIWYIISIFLSIFIDIYSILCKNALKMCKQCRPRRVQVGFEEFGEPLKHLSRLWRVRVRYFLHIFKPFLYKML